MNIDFSGLFWFGLAVGGLLGFAMGLGLGLLL